MVKNDLAALIQKAIAAAQAAGNLPPFDRPEVSVGHPKEPGHGDYDCPVALKLARAAKIPPMKIAQAIARHLPAADFLAGVEVAPPGFLNFTLSERWLAQQVAAILDNGEHFGQVDIGQGKRVQVEFVSVNPTGPIHIGHARGAALGDSLARLLAAAGYQVQREYYFNDAGSQMDKFYHSLYARYCQALGRDEPVPEDGYHGNYMLDLAREIVAEQGDRFLSLPREQAIAALAPLGAGRMIGLIKEDLGRMGVQFDCWFLERSVYSGGQYEKIMALLKERGFLEAKDGAIWFTSSTLGQDKDNVVVRSSGEPTYFATDIAYHYNKFIERGFDWVINIWGADHQGHVPRMKAMMQALGLDPERLTLIIMQLVTLKRGGEVVRISKRTGDIIALRDVLDEVGPDAVRFLLISRAADAQMDFDLDLAKAQSEENPVFYVQYAHARVASIQRYADEALSRRTSRNGGRDSASEERGGDGEIGTLLTHPAELALIRQMLRLPELVEEAATRLEPHHLPHYAQELAASFHSFYKQCRVVSSEPADAALSAARLKLVQAARIVLANTLYLMGMAAPEQM
jgi:arginyl-tRNA synthetase